MKASTANMLDEKRRFIARIQTLLAFDEKNNQVDCLEYEVKEHGPGWYEEYIHIVYVGGHVKTLLVTANSNGTNLKAIAAEVYR